MHLFECFFTRKVYGDVLTISCRNISGTFLAYFTRMLTERKIMGPLKMRETSSGPREVGDWLVFVREFVKMKTISFVNYKKTKKGRTF